MEKTTTDCILNLAYYNLFSATLLMYRYERLFRDFGLAETGKTKMMINNAKEKVAGVIKILETFDATFVRAANGSKDKFDSYHSIANELIALNLMYISHCYQSTKDSASVFKLMRSMGEPCEELDNLSDMFLRKIKL